MVSLLSTGLPVVSPNPPVQPGGLGKLRGAEVKEISFLLWEQALDFSLRNSLLRLSKKRSESQVIQVQCVHEAMNRFDWDSL